MRYGKVAGGEGKVGSTGEDVNEKVMRTEMGIRIEEFGRTRRPSHAKEIE